MLLTHWGEFDGYLARRGAPSILTMTPRRAFNMVYSRMVEWMSEEDRKEFEADINLSLLQLQVRMAAEKEQEKRRRAELAQQFGEVG